MTTEKIYIIAADLMLLLHALVVAFVVFGLVSIIAGKLLDWHWVHNFWFRLLHLVAICFVVLQSWVGVVCPLTSWEMALRERGGQATYSGGFFAHWVETILYYQAPAWVFTALYTGFGLVVIASWFWVPPEKFRK